ncbi:MAG TPA: carbon-nitrogen hydrolase family protein [Nevskiaceae bacterium]|nr:carbon-nitrogen hydrolase family protein [Nevskiaceae bacterium]
MIVAAVQMNSGDSVQANLDAAGKLLEEAVRQNAALAVLPENFAFMGAHDRDKLAHAEDDGRGPIQDFLHDIARKLKLWIVAGTIPIKVAGDAGKVYAASLVIDAHGERRARYDKIHLFDVDVPGAGEKYRESSTIAHGELKSVVVDSPAGRLGLTVCYDLRFPELYRRLAAEQAQVICVPSAFTQKTGEAHWEVLLRARAIENQCYVIAAGQAGQHPGGRRTFGHSMIIGPWGEVLADRAEAPGIVVARIAPARLEELRQTFPVLSHRRLS